MADTPEPNPHPTESALARDARIRAERAETAAMGFILVGVLLLLIGLVLALARSRGMVCLIFGGVSFITGCIENLRAEVLRVRAKIERD